MAGKLVFIALNLGLLFASQGQIMDDVCHKDDFECNYPNIKHTGDLNHGKCKWDHVLRRIHYTTLLECVKECMITSQCVGINYRKNWKTCDVVDGTHSPLKEETGCLYSKIDTWSKTLAGKCADHKCKAGERCSITESRTTGEETKCEPAYCKELPSIESFTIVERFGLYRNLETGSKVTCHEGFKATGKPYVICKKDGTWKYPTCTWTPKHCGKLLPSSKSGVYRIYPSGIDTPGFDVFCDMNTAEGGWTVFQNRTDGKTSFDRNWIEYEDGFGTAGQEYWMGNKRLHQITSENDCTLIVNYAYDNREFSPNYTDFIIGNERSKYEITLTPDSGWDVFWNIGRQFTTKDNTKFDCVRSGEVGGWWHSDNCKWDFNINVLYNALEIKLFSYTWKISHTKMMMRCS